MTFEVGFNKLYIIKSLTDGDMHTAEMLNEDVSSYAKYFADGAVHVELESAYSKADLLLVLDKIANETEDGNGVFPAIHFECHGECIEKGRRGLVTASSELIKWKELGDKLHIINRKTHNQLFVTMAVCHGAYLLKSISIYKAPFWGFVGPDKEARQSDLLLRYDEFYRELFQTNSFDNAMTALLNANDEVEDVELKKRTNYGFYNSTKIFVNTFIKHEKNIAGSIGVQNKGLEFFKAHKKEFDGKFKSFSEFLPWYIKEYRDHLPEEFSKIRNQFFMLSEFDNNDAKEIPESYQEFKVKFPSPLV